MGARLPNLTNADTDQDCQCVNDAGRGNVAPTDYTVDAKYSPEVSLIATLAPQDCHSKYITVSRVRS